jgi:UDP-GlcNAc:undecaprenyl-phosphate GlcNAc-1-phosphate transferase
MISILSGSLGFIFLAALAVALVICACARPIGETFGVLAHPDALRRYHSLATPQVGGIAILSALTVWLSGILMTGSATEAPLTFAVLLCGLGVGLVGFADDQSHTSPTARILSILVFVSIAIVMAPELRARVINWGSFMPTALPLWAFVPLASVAAVGLVNAVNMADGQNGVVGGMYVVWTLCLLCVTTGIAAKVALVLMSASLIFLAFNLRGKLFLGDCGSYGVTFVIGLLALLAHARGQVSFEALIVWFFVPVMDCLRLLTTRPFRGRSPFVGDRDHFHHRLEDKMGKILGLASYLAAVAISSLLATLEPRFTLVCLSGLSAFYFSFAWLTDTAATPAAQVFPGENDAMPEATVIPMQNERSDRRRDIG